MIGFKRLYSVVFFAFAFSGIVACGEMHAKDVVTIDEVIDSKEETVIEDVNEYGSEKESTIQDVTVDQTRETTDELISVSPIDENVQETISADERLLVIPNEEDIPGSIKKVFTEYAEFDLVFDLGFDVEPKENDNKMDLSVYYFTPEEAFQEQYRITTDVIDCACRGPYSYLGEHIELWIWMMTV